MQTFSVGDQHVQTFSVGTGPTSEDICTRNRTNMCRHLQQEQDQHMQTFSVEDQHVKTFSVTTRPTHVDICSRSRTNMCRHLQQEQDQHVQTFAVGTGPKLEENLLQKKDQVVYRYSRHFQYKQDQHMQTFTVGTGLLHEDICSRKYKCEGYYLPAD